MTDPKLALVITLITIISMLFFGVMGRDIKNDDFPRATEFAK